MGFVHPPSNGGTTDGHGVMLATAVAALPTGPGWAFEFKWDGVRALLDISEHGTRIYGRNGNDITEGYPELMALGADVGDGLFDGEIVALTNGRPSFEALQRRMHVRGAAVADLVREVPVTFIAFDLLRRYGVDLRARSYVERRATLDRWIAAHPEWTLSPYFDDGAATEAAARQHELEGVVAKRLASTYRPGVRSPDWQKLRFVRTGDFVVVGWESSAEHPGLLSSLVLAEFRGGALVHVGKVGSGLDLRTTTSLQKELKARPTSVLAGPVPASIGGRRVRWVEPDAVVEVRFTERTEDGKLRHPVFLRVRTDKTVSDAESSGDGGE
jgi:bifunctional non-homologous end joining protein LigD